MILGLQYEEQLPSVVRDELQQLISSIQTAFNGIDITGIIQQATNAAAIGRVTVATQPTLGASDAGKLYIITDTNHLVRWTGTAWEFLDEEPGKIVPFAVAPRADMWVACDGSATTYLKGGATLTLQAFTTPNVNGNPCYIKSGAAYGVTVTAKVAPTTTGTGTTGTGNTGTGVTGSSTDTFTTAASANTLGIMSSGLATQTVSSHVHTGTTDGHTHTVPALSVPSLSVPALSIGAIEMANLVMPMYFRR